MLRTTNPVSNTTRGRLVQLAAFTVALALTAGPALAARRSSVLAQLVARAQIQNLLTEYYGNLGHGSHGMGYFYAPDGVLDVNGIVAHGAKGIDALYKKVGANAKMPSGKYNMLITNLRIVVHGDTATSEDIWTGVVSPTPESTPRFVEQGHERDVLVKLHGRWVFKHRVITSDGGLPKMFQKTYRDRDR